MTPRFLIGGALALCVAIPAKADVTADWRSGKTFESDPVVAPAEAPVELKFGHPAPPASLVPAIWQDAINRVKQDTGGALAFTEYGGGTLLGAKDGFRAVRGGVAEWATCYTTFDGRAFSLSRIFEQPFTAPTNPMATVRIAQELAPDYFAPEFAAQDVIFGSVAAFPPTDIMSKEPIRRWEDLEGLKIVAQGFPPEAAEAMGATFVNIPYPEIYVALQQGLADALIWVDAGFIPYKIYEVAKYHTTVGLTGGGIHHCYNKDWFSALEPDIAAAFYGVQEPMSMAIAKRIGFDFVKDARQTYEQNGVELISLSDEERSRWREKLLPVVDAWVEAQEAQGKPARELMDKIATLSQKYNEMSPDELMQLSIDEPVQGIK